MEPCLRPCDDDRNPCDRDSKCPVCVETSAGRKICSMEALGKYFREGLKPYLNY